MNKPYLYGANISGIQSFIFATGKLKEIVGASELIERWCTTEFENCVGSTYQKKRQILGAAGRIRYLFPDKKSCADFVRSFGQKLTSRVPELKLQQAVISLTDNFEKDYKLLDERLRTAANKLPNQHGLAWMISERSRRSALPAVDKQPENGRKRVFGLLEQEKKYYFNEAQKTSKDYKSLTDKIRLNNIDKFPKDLKDIVGRRQDEWMAIVHIDGNNMGQQINGLVHGLSQADLSNEKAWNLLKSYSEQLGKSTEEAAKSALADTIKKHPKTFNSKKHNMIPLRPVLLGGDDLTLIIRGDLAIDFTAAYLKYFQKETAVKLGQFAKYSPALKNGLTACAGIAFIKFNYPFHYGANLSDNLGKVAKKASKNLLKLAKAASLDMEHPPASLAFHRVQSSFVEKYSTIIKKELTAEAVGGENVKFNFGPYFLEPTTLLPHTTIHQLQTWVKNIKRPTAPQGKLRNWLSTLHQDANLAQQELNRIRHISSAHVHPLGLNEAIQTRGQQQYTHLFDVLTLMDIQKEK